MSILIIRSKPDRANPDPFRQLEIAVNNAATEGQPRPVIKQTEDSYKATFYTKVLGILFSLKYEMKAMLAQGSGSIVNISSTFCELAAAGVSIYAASTCC